MSADWSRERKGRFWDWDPPRSLLAAIRAYQGASGLFGPLARAIAVVRFRFWSVVTGAEIPINTCIGGGLMIPHPNGIVVHPSVEIGVNCLFFQQVTLGATEKGVPQVGAHVDIGAGAKIIGPVRVGDRARIGANAVVTRDVPPGATVAGIPARIISTGNAGEGRL